jgi:phenylalanyl-tRNA synthetase beta chain
VVECLATALHLPSAAYRATKGVPYLHPGRAAEVILADRPAGAFGELHPKVAVALGLGDRAVLAAEFDLEVLLAGAPERFAYRPLSEAPPALRDIAVVVDEGLANEAVVGEIRAAGGDLLANVRLFDVYRGESIPAGKKSLAYALTYQADRTLKDTEIDQAHKRIESRLQHVLKAAIRGK